MYGNRWVHRLAVFTTLMTFLLLCAGALVTGTGSGLAVPDWPLSYGQYFPPMVGGVLYEHGHRMIAGTVGILTLFLSIGLWLTEARAWVRWLGTFAVVAVVAQALLGGLTVIYRLPVAVSVSHACLAQIFFSTTVLLSLVTGPGWFRPMYAIDEGDARVPLSKLALLTSVGFFLQLLIGAVMRHTGAGLAIPDFPTVFGGVLPPTFTFPIAIHFAHRTGALVMTLLTGWLVTRVLTQHAGQLKLTAFVGALAGAVAFQIMLGASVIWLRRPVPVTTAHLAMGALCLASSVSVTFLAFRLQGFGFSRPWWPRLTLWSQTERAIG